MRRAIVDSIEVIEFVVFVRVKCAWDFAIRTRQEKKGCKAEEQQSTH